MRKLVRKSFAIASGEAKLIAPVASLVDLSKVPVGSKALKIVYRLLASHLLRHFAHNIEDNFNSIRPIFTPGDAARFYKEVRWVVAELMGSYYKGYRDVTHDLSLSLNMLVDSRASFEARRAPVQKASDGARPYNGAFRRGARHGRRPHDRKKAYSGDTRRAFFSRRRNLAHPAAISAAAQRPVIPRPYKPHYEQMSHNALSTNKFSSRGGPRVPANQKNVSGGAASPRPFSRARASYGRGPLFSAPARGISSAAHPARRPQVLRGRGGATSGRAVSPRRARAPRFTSGSVAANVLLRRLGGHFRSDPVSIQAGLPRAAFSRRRARREPFRAARSAPAARGTPAKSPFSAGNPRKFSVVNESSADWLQVARSMNLTFGEWVKKH